LTVLMGSGLCGRLSCEQDEQLLERDEAFDFGEVGLEEFVAAVPAVAVLVYEDEDAVEAVVVTDSDEAVDGRGGFSGKVNREVPPADMGLIRVGESFERKSR
jgi:hypothetical protein